jgi:hypothetical protein
MAEVEHVFGAEAQSQTDELHALPEADPLDQQAITWCLAADYLPGEDHTIDKPRDYERLKTLQLDCWPGPQLSWTLSDFVTHQPRERPLFVGPTDTDSLYDLWHARRIAYRQNFEPGSYASDITLANWPQMDYWENPVVGVSPAAQALALDEARQFSLAFFYWMQTDAPRHDGGYGYRGLRLRGDVLGTTDGLAKQAYYREGRRLQAEYTVLEQHIGVAARPGETGAERFADSVGIGAYRIDLHPSTRGRNTVDIDSFPFQIPLGALLPVRVENLLQEPGHHTHHQRRVPRARHGMEHRRSRRHAGGVRPRAQATAASSTGRQGLARGLPAHAGTARRSAGMAKLRRVDASSTRRLPARQALKSC